MAAPPPEEYLAENFDPNSLRVPQLRSILLAHGHGYPSGAKKADLVSEFQLHVLSQATTLRSAAANVRPSGKGIIAVSDNGDEAPAVPTKRPRGRARKTATAEPEIIAESIIAVEETTEPPSKKPRGRTRKSVSVEVESTSAAVRKPRGRASRAAIVTEDVDEGVEAEIEDEATPAPSSRPGRNSLPPSSPGSLLSAPTSTSRRRSNIGSSSSVSTDIRTPSEGPVDVKPRSTGKKTTSALKIMDNLREESEKEDETPKKVSKPKTPRRSTGDESGFSDFNPFQSGSEEAAERERRRRKSSIGLGSVIKSKPAQPRFSEPGPNASTPTSILRKVGPSSENLRTPPSAVKESLRANKELDAAVEYNRAVQEKLNQITSEDSSNELNNDLQVSISSVVDENPSNSLVKRVSDQVAVVPHARKALPLGALFLLLLSLVLNFKNQSSSIGFCDSGSNVNDIILHRQSSLEGAKACIIRKAQLDLDDRQAAQAIHCDASALPLLPFVPRPSTCAPCPLHAVCDDGKIIACEPEYILRSHPLSFAAPLVDGLPGVGPEAFPPSCRPDTAKKRMIGGLAQEMEKELARGRGVIVCSGWQNEDGKKTAGERFGVEESALREIFAVRRDPKFSKEQFDEVFEAALKDLLEHEDVFESIDINGHSWYAATRTDLTLGCRAKLEAKDLLDRWKSQLGSTAAVIAAIAYLRSEIRRRQQEKYRAEELVEVALRRLQDQEQLHYIDPVTTPNSYIPRDQLRDLVMPPKGSTASRSRLWAKVLDMVENNANVAVRDREVKGEVWRTWEWSGVGERHVTFE